MSDLRITCIQKSHPHGSHDHITHAGNPAVPWMWTVEAIIAVIDSGTNTFYVLDPATGRRATVGVVRQAGRTPYIRTYADGYWNDNLLSLNACPLKRAA